MYKLLKKYKNLENHNINVKVFRVVRMEERAVIVKFFPQNSINENFFNFCPIEQQDISFQSFEFKRLVSWSSEDSFKSLEILHPNFWMVGKHFKLPLQNSLLNFEPNLANFYLNKVVLNRYLNLYRKYFIRLEKKYRMEILNKVKLVFLNKNIIQIINSYNISKTSYKILYINFLRKCILVVFFRLDCINKWWLQRSKKYSFNKKTLKEIKKNVLKKKLFLCVYNHSRKNLLFKIPGIFESFYLPYKHWIHKKKWNFFKNSLIKWYKYSFFKLIFHSVDLLGKKKKNLKFQVRLLISYFNKFNKFKKNFKKKFKNKFIKEFKKSKKKFDLKLKSQVKLNLKKIPKSKKKVDLGIHPIPNISIKKKEEFQKKSKKKVK